MFDFTISISRNRQPDVKSNQSHALHLTSGSYVKYLVRGKGFCGEVFSHSNDERQGYGNRRDIHLFVIGHTYTNREHAGLDNVKQHKLDTTSLLDFYERFGQEMIRYIKGIFVMFIADEQNQRYYAFVSRSGLLKLFYYRDQDRVMLSTSMASLLQNLPNKPVLDNVAVLQHGFFDYTLGTRTHFKDVQILDNLSYLAVEGGSDQVIEYTSMASKLTGGAPLSWRDTKSLLPSKFNQVMDTIIPAGPFNSAITAGYDSRTVLSYIVLHGITGCRLYSWAADDRYYDVAIAKRIASMLSLDYTHVHLGDDMLANYPFLASQQLYWTDGLGSINRTNQMYSHSILAEFSRELVTGYFGSELLRPLHRLNVMMRSTFMDLLLSKNREQLLESQFADYVRSTGFKDTFLSDHRIDFMHSVLEHMHDLDVESDNGVKVLHYLIRYGFWKFFGQEFHAQRIHTNMHSPYIDDDFIDYILSSCIREIHRGTYKRDPLVLFRSQAMYNPILKRNCAKLMKIPTNKGFAPSDFESALFPLNVLIKFQLNRMKKKKEAVKGFVGYGWHQYVYKAFPRIVNGEDGVFKSLDEHLLQDGAYFSLKKWLWERS